MGFAIFEPPAAVESATTAHVPARTGAFEAYKTILLFARAEAGNSTAHTTKFVASKNVLREVLLKFATFISGRFVNCYRALSAWLPRQGQALSPENARGKRIMSRSRRYIR